MSKINTRTQNILESMILEKFEEKREALESELDAITKRDREIVKENTEKCKDAIVCVVDKASNDIVKLLKTAGLEIGHKYYDCNHFVCLFNSDGKLKENWKDYIRPIAEKSKRQQSLEEDLEEHTSKCKKAINELVLRVTLGCKYNDVVDFINNLEV